MGNIHSLWGYESVFQFNAEGLEYLRMPIFTEEDVEQLENCVLSRVHEDKEMFFSYFEHEAVEHYIEYFTNNKHNIISDIEREIRKQSPNMPVKIPIVSFYTFKETSRKHKQTRRRLQEQALLEFGQPASYFQCLSGIHITDLRAIFRHSNFKQIMGELLGSEFELFMTSPQSAIIDGVTEYSNTLWLKFNPKCTSSSKSLPASV